MQTNLDIRKLTPHTGAEILGVDLAEASDAVIGDIRSALLENTVVFFRDQRMSVEQHKAFGRRFGRLHVHPATVPQIPEHPEIIVIESDASSTRVAGEEWHSDSSADTEPPLGSILYMHEVPTSGGGDTLFANMYEAYEALSKPMRSFLDKLTAVHDAERLRGFGAGIRSGGDRLPSCEHPVVRTHPETGRRGLYVNRVYTSHIVQLAKGESKAMLDFLFAHMETPLFQCRFKWRPGSVAFWDNRCTLHHAVWDYFPERRSGHRVTICGDRPI